MAGQQQAMNHQHITHMLTKLRTNCGEDIFVCNVANIKTMMQTKSSNTKPEDTSYEEET